MQLGGSKEQAPRSRLQRSRLQRSRRCDGKEGKCGKVTSNVDKRNIVLMRNDEMYELEVACSMRQTHVMSPELDSGALLKILFLE
jgi:hypothetical protein